MLIIFSLLIETLTKNAKLGDYLDFSKVLLTGRVLTLENKQRLSKKCTLH